MIYLYTFSSWFYTFILTPSKTVGLYVLEIPKINQSIDFIWKLWISVNFTKTNTANPLTLGLYCYLLWNTLTWAWQYFTKSKLSFWNLYLKKGEIEREKRGIEKQPILKNIHKNLFKSFALLYCLYTGEPLTTRLPDSRVQILVFSLAVYLK